jgi:hypothetical protein
MDPLIELWPGFLLDGRYEVLERLGEGTMAYVVRAFDSEIDREVACKIPLDASAYKAKALLAQWKKLQALSSRHLPAVLGYERHRTNEPSFPFLVMEVVVGQKLVEWRPGKPFRRRVEVLAAVAETIGALGAAHGDLDGGNIMITANERVVLIDPEAEAFGSSRPRSAESNDVQDIRGFRAVIQECLSDDERKSLGILLERFDVPTSDGPNPKEMGAALRHLLSLPLLPGETSASLAELAAAHKKRTADANVTYRRICQVRDLASRNLLDLLRRLCEPFGLQVSGSDSTMFFSDPKVAKELNIENGRGQLHYRQFAVKSSAGDELLLALTGGNNFRLPWPDGNRPGLVEKGWLNVLRDSNAVSMLPLELHDVDGVPALLIAEIGHIRPLDERAIDRALRILVEVVYPGVVQATFPQDRPAGSPALPVPDCDFLRPSFAALGIPVPLGTKEVCRAAIEVTLRLEQNSKLGNGAFGSSLSQIFDLPDHYESRLKFVTATVARFVETHGQFFAPLYRFDVQVVDESKRRLRVEVSGCVAGGDVVTWPFEFSARTPELGS